MIIVGGFYSLIHLTIIVVNKTTKFIMINKILSYVIVRAVALVILFSVYTLASGAVDDSPNVSLYTKLFNNCEAFEQTMKENKIILRIDDIQAFAWADIQEQMIIDSIDRGIPLVLGVIPIWIEEDKKIYNYINKNNCNLEIAQHGWDHSGDVLIGSSEFSGLTRTEAYERIMRGKPMLEKLAGKEVITFIPPSNSFSQGTGLALRDAGFKIISAEGGGKYDFTASTYNSEKGALNPVEEVLLYCKEGLEKNNLCVIMLHPQDYASKGVLDKEKYGMFLVLLDKLIELDAMFIKMSDLALLENNFSRLPDSFKDNELLNGLNLEEIKKSRHLEVIDLFYEHEPETANNDSYIIK